MRHIGTATMLGCALWAGLGASAAAAPSPRGKAYSVHVYTSFGTNFDDCFAFGQGGILTVAAYGPLLYRLDELNSQPEDWQATARTNPPFGFVLTFHGSVGGANAQTVSADGVSSEGNSFILRGVLDPGCAASAAGRQGGSSPYRR